MYNVTDFSKIAKKEINTLVWINTKVVVGCMRYTIMKQV